MLDPRCVAHIKEREGAGYFPCNSPNSCFAECVEAMRRLSEEHPLDAPLGVIHELALILHISGQTDWAVKLADAHNKIQSYVVKNM